MHSARQGPRGARLPRANSTQISRARGLEETSPSLSIRSLQNHLELMLPRRATLIFGITRRTFYDTTTKNDTIFANATTINSNKGSPLGVIRISGAKSGLILSGVTGRASLKPRHATLVKIFEPNTRELIDLGLAIWFPRPQSYTGEDVCELHLHGSQAIMTKILTTLGSIPGVRPAEPGEFTRRAVMNNKMSLMQAESLPDLLKSSTDKQRRLALNGLDGSTRQKYDEWTQQLVQVLAHLEASIDFGEDELLGERVVVSECMEKLKVLANIVGAYIEASARCRDFINDGAHIAILGKPNAGKSTFMNLICGRDLSIVSDLSGTTRDLVRHSLELGGHSVTLCDTAGLRNLDALSTKTSEKSPTNLIEKHHSIEQEGIKRALEAARRADILVYLIDGADISRESASELAMKTLEEIGTALHIVYDRQDASGGAKCVHLVMNKLDLNDYLKSGDLSVTQLREMMRRNLQKQHPALVNVDLSLISCKTQENFDQFVRSLTERLDKMCSPPLVDSLSSGSRDHQREEPVQFDYVNQRHLSLLKSMHRHLELAAQLDLETIDKMAQHVRESVDYLSRVVGSISSEEVIDVIFRDFCIGK